MKKKLLTGLAIGLFALNLTIVASTQAFAATPTGELITSDFWIGAMINTEGKGSVEAVWQKGGEATTSRGDSVIWGYFYASPSDVSWGSSNNPDLYVKIWFDVNGRVDVNYFHVSVPEIEVYSGYQYDGVVAEQGTTTMDRRYIRQYYENGQSYSSEQAEDGYPSSGNSPTGSPSGNLTINDLSIGAMINTEEIGSVDALWRLGGQDTTSRGDQVVWGHFYASPSDVSWGSEDNPDLFVKIWFDVSGRVDVNYFHVSVPDIEVYSDLPSDGVYAKKGTTIMANRYIRHEYCNDQDSVADACGVCGGDGSSCQAGTCALGAQTVTWEGLEWQRCDDGNTYKHEEANVYCQDLELGGYSDWHLPTNDELKSLVVCSNGTPTPLQDPPAHPYICSDGSYGDNFVVPTIDASFECRSDSYWSSSLDESGYPSSVYFTNGNTIWTLPSYSFYVRCVR